MCAKMETLCDQCHRSFSRNKKDINKSKKNGKPQFCSKECLKEHRKNFWENKDCLKVSVTCANCGVPLAIFPSKFSNSQSGQFYCSRSCSVSSRNKKRKGTHRVEAKHATCTNCRKDYILKRRPKGVANCCSKSCASAVSARNRLISEETRAKLKKQWEHRPRLPVFNCVICGTPFFKAYAANVTCSVSCRLLHRYGGTKEDLIDTVQKMVSELGFVPGNSYVPKKVVSAACHFFGSWNAFISEIGLTPNFPWTARKRIPCHDGHIAESVSELLIDNWLFAQGIKHERSKPYPDPTRKFTCDFYLPDYDIWVEYFGLVGKAKYDRSIEEKQKLAETYGIRLLGIFPAHLYPIFSLNLEMFSNPI